MIFAAGALLPQEELPTLLDTLEERLNETRSGPPLDVDVVLDAADILGRALDSGELDPLLAQYAPPGALEELLPLCEKEGVGVVPYQLLQGGMLTGKYRRGQEAPAGSRLAEKPEWMKPFTDETYDVIERCAAEAAAEGVTMTQHALRWALAQPGVVSALVGVKREEQIDEAAGAVR